MIKLDTPIPLDAANGRAPQEGVQSAVTPQQAESQPSQMVVEEPVEQDTTGAMDLVAQAGAGVDSLKAGLVSFLGGMVEPTSPHYNYAKSYAAAKHKLASEVPMEQISSLSEMVSDPLKTVRVGLQNFARSVPVMATTAIPGVGPAISAAAMAGDIVDQQDPENRNMGAAIAGGIGQAVLERTGMRAMGALPGSKQFTSSVAKTATGRRALGVAEGTLGEAVTEGGQQVIQNIATNQELEGATEGVGQAALTGGITGGVGHVGIAGTRKVGKVAKSAISSTRASDKFNTGPISPEIQQVHNNIINQAHEFDAVDMELNAKDLTPERREELLVKRAQLNDNIGESSLYESAHGLDEAGVSLSPHSLDVDVTSGLSANSRPLGKAYSLLSGGEITSGQVKRAGQSSQAMKIGVSSYAGSGENGKTASYNALQANNRIKGKEYLQKIAGNFNDQLSIIKDLSSDLKAQRDTAGSSAEKGAIQQRLTMLDDAHNTLQDIYANMKGEQAGRSEIQDSIAYRAQKLSDTLVRSGVSNDFNAVKLAKTYLTANQIMMKQDPSFYEGTVNPFNDFATAGVISSVSGGATDAVGLTARIHNARARGSLKKRLTESRGMVTNAKPAPVAPTPVPEAPVDAPVDPIVTPEPEAAPVVEEVVQPREGSLGMATDEVGKGRAAKASTKSEPTVEEVKSENSFGMHRDTVAEGRAVAAAKKAAQEAEPEVEVEVIPVVEEPAVLESSIGMQRDAVAEGRAQADAAQRAIDAEKAQDQAVQATNASRDLIAAQERRALIPDEISELQEAWRIVNETKPTNAEETQDQVEDRDLLAKEIQNLKAELANAEAKVSQGTVEQNLDSSLSELEKGPDADISVLKAGADQAVAEAKATRTNTSLDLVSRPAAVVAPAPAKTRFQQELDSELAGEAVRATRSAKTDFEKYADQIKATHLPEYANLQDSIKKGNDLTRVKADLKEANRLDKERTTSEVQRVNKARKAAQDAAKATESDVEADAQAVQDFRWNHIKDVIKSYGLPASELRGIKQRHPEGITSANVTSIVKELQKASAIVNKTPAEKAAEAALKAANTKAGVKQTDQEKAEEKRLEAEEEARQVTYAYTEQVDTLKNLTRRLGMTAKSRDAILDDVYGPIPKPLTDNQLRSVWKKIKTHPETRTNLRRAATAKANATSAEKAQVAKQNADAAIADKVKAQRVKSGDAIIEGLAKQVSSLSSKIDSMNTDAKALTVVVNAPVTVDFKAAVEGISKSTADTVVKEMKEEMASANETQLAHMESMASAIKAEFEARDEAQAAVKADAFEKAVKTLTGIQKLISQRRKTKSNTEEVNGANGLLFREDIRKIQALMGNANTAYSGAMGANLKSKAFGIYRPEGQAMYENAAEFKKARDLAKAPKGVLSTGPAPVVNPVVTQDTVETTSQDKQREAFKPIEKATTVTEKPAPSADAVKAPVKDTGKVDRMAAIKEAASKVDVPVTTPKKTVIADKPAKKVTKQSPTLKSEAPASKNTKALTRAEQLDVDLGYTDVEAPNAERSMGIQKTLDAYKGDQKTLVDFADEVGKMFAASNESFSKALNKSDPKVKKSLRVIGGLKALGYDHKNIDSDSMPTTEELTKAFDKFEGKRKVQNVQADSLAKEAKAEKVLEKIASAPEKGILSKVTSEDVVEKANKSKDVEDSLDTAEDNASDEEIYKAERFAKIALANKKAVAKTDSEIKRKRLQDAINRVDPADEDLYEVVAEGNKIYGMLKEGSEGLERILKLHPGAKIIGLAAALASGGAAAGEIGDDDDFKSKQDQINFIKYSTSLGSAKERAAFMAQIVHESGGAPVSEKGYYKSSNRISKIFNSSRRQGIPANKLTRNTKKLLNTVYGGEWGRDNLGNTEDGDGYKYRGRGYIQLTGRSNYAAMGKRLGIDLVNKPELALRSDVAFEIAKTYWGKRVAPKVKDFGNTDKISKLVNGGTNGIGERRHLFNTFMEEVA